MNRFQIHSAISFLLLIVHAAAPVTAGEQNPARPEQTPAIKALLNGLAREIKEGRIVGAQIVIGHEMRIVLDRCLGVRGPNDSVAVDAQTMFCIGSCSKPIASACVLRLVSEKKLTLDEPIRRWLPEFRMPRLADGTPAERGPTVRELLAHRGGIYSQRDGLSARQIHWIRDFKLTLEQSVKGIAEEPLLAEPGSKYAYSGAGYCVVGRVAEVATGEPFDKLLKDQIGRPLGWKRTGYFLRAGEKNVAIGGLRRGGGIRPSPDAPHRAGSEYRLALVGGSLYSTAGEIARFARMVLHDGRSGDTVVLPRTAMREILKRPHADGNYGLGWVLELGKGDEIVALDHNGSLSSYRSFIRIDRTRRCYLVLNWTVVTPLPKDEAAIAKIIPLARRALMAVGKDAKAR